MHICVVDMTRGRVGKSYIMLPEMLTEVLRNWLRYNQRRNFFGEGGVVGGRVFIIYFWLA